MADAWIGLCLCIGVGLHRGEALGLTWQHIDFTSGTLRVEQSLRRVTKLDGPDLGGVKTYASRREIVLPASLTAALEQHRALQSSLRAVRGLIPAALSARTSAAGHKSKPSTCYSSA